MDPGDLHQIMVLVLPSHTPLTQLLDMFTLGYLKGIQIQRNFSFNMYWELKLHIRMNCNIRSSARISQSDKKKHPMQRTWLPSEKFLAIWASLG